METIKTTTNKIIKIQKNETMKHESKTNLKKLNNGNMTKIFKEKIKNELRTLLYKKTKQISSQWQMEKYRKGQNGKMEKWKMGKWGHGKLINDKTIKCKIKIFKKRRK